MEISDFKVQIGERLKEFAFSKGIKHQELAETLGYKASAFYRVLKGENAITLELIFSIKNHFPDFSFDWLFTGQKRLPNQNNGNVVVGENNVAMQINNPPSAEVLAERVKALEEQLKLKDQIIELLKGKT